ncbi:MAG: hypothetical protein RBR67_17460 [Desulfobacterium sp.]|nr:hypothetical protein [Desulfobacterium sp.]
MHYKILSIFAYLFIVFISCSHAASVRQVTMDEMLLECQFVFEGRVLSLESEESSPKRIHTYVTFEIIDTIKGEYPCETITLSFLGGTVGDVTMAVSDMKVPQVGERGIYFVESLERSQVHPLYGWNQGHFLVQPDDTGMERIMTNNEQPVTDVMGNMSAEEMVSGQEAAPFLSKGVALGVTFAMKNNHNKGLTAEKFKKILREEIERANE